MISSPYFKLGPKQVANLSGAKRKPNEIARGHGWIATKQSDGETRLFYLTGSNPESERSKQIAPAVLEKLIDGDITIDDVHFDRHNG